MEHVCDCLSVCLSADCRCYWLSLIKVCLPVWIDCLPSRCLTVRLATPSDNVNAEMDKLVPFSAFDVNNQVFLFTHPRCDVVMPLSIQSFQFYSHTLVISLMTLLKFFLENIILFTADGLWRSDVLFLFTNGIIYQWKLMRSLTDLFTIYQTLDAP